MMVYLAAISALLGFHLQLLFEWKSFLLVVLGTLLLSCTSIRRPIERDRLLHTMAFSAILSSFIVALVILFSGVTSAKEGDFRTIIAIGCRPLLYGVIIYSILYMQSSKPHKSPSADEEQNTAPDFMETDTAALDYRQFGLTRREAEIADLIRRGLTNKEIADELFIAETTVKKQVSHIFEKLGIRKREELQ